MTVSNDDLRDVLINTKISLNDKLLLILFANFGTPLTATEIKALALKLGVADVGFWQTTATLNTMLDYAIRHRDGWMLTPEGRDYVLTSGLVGATAHNVVISQLRTHLAAIADPQTKSFIDEAIRCYEHKLFRAAVVFSWIGAVAVLYTYVVQHRLADFNTEATALFASRKLSWKGATTTDDLTQMKESDFLHTLDRMSIIGKNVKQELLGCLTLRNGCGHPNSLVVGESKAAAHLETLIDNVFTKFS